MAYLKQIHRTLVSNRLIALLCIVLIFLGRIFAGATFYQYITWLVFVIQLGIIFLLLRINYVHRIIVKKTVLPVVFFLLLTASYPSLYNNLEGNISAFLFVLCLALTLKNYHNPKSQPDSFNIALILTLGSMLIWRPLLFFIPLFWIGFYRFRALNGKSFAASLLGIFIVYLFLSAWCLHINDWSLFFNNLPQFDKTFNIRWIEIRWYDWVLDGFLLFLLIMTATQIFASGISEKIKTISFFKYLYIIIVVLFVLAIFFDQAVYNIQCIIYIPVAFIIGYYFTMLDNNKWVTYLFLFTILLFIGNYIYRVYSL
ncbi:MAG: hypothetical protein FWD60_06355 [Candidatus Azobacteroides sp.]|nr:hypothetical protein [Candidatus Azobacteroides sp.]